MTCNSATYNKYSLGEEIAHTVIHGLGIPLSIAALTVLVTFSALNGNAWHISSTSIYGATLILLYTASTLYHGIPHMRAKPVLQKLDHAAIFLLIAGTYTPFTLVPLRGAWGWSLFGLVWSIAIFGVLLELFGKGRFKRWSMTLYLGLGWLVVVAIHPMLLNVDSGGLWLLLGGGLHIPWERYSMSGAAFPITTRSGTCLFSAAAPCISSRCSSM